MSNFSVVIPLKLNFLCLLRDVNVDVIPYVCYYNFIDRELVFKQRYDSEWYINNIGKLPTRPECYGITGYVKVDEYSYAAFFISVNGYMFISTLASYDTWMMSNVEGILVEAILLNVPSNLNAGIVLEEVMSEFLGCSLKLEEQVVGSVNKIVIGTQSHSIAVNGLTIVDGNQITLTKRKYKQNIKMFNVYNTFSEAKVSVLVNEKYIYMVEGSLEELKDIRFIGNLVDVLSNMKVISSEHSEEDRCYESSILKATDPRVYYPGIARHCPVKPIPIKEYDPGTVNNKYQVLYPKSNPVLYKAKEGYYIGLKLNKVPPPEDHPYDPLPAFPCCFVTSGYSSFNVYEEYLSSKDDEEFKAKVIDRLHRISSPTLLPYNYKGSCYTPLNSIPELHGMIRTRIADWFDQLNCNDNFKDVTDDEYCECENNYRMLGHRDTTTLRRYITNPLHDIRITYHMFEKRLNREIVIYINRNKEVTRFIKPSFYSTKGSIHVIVYESAGLEGYELLIKEKHLK